LKANVSGKRALEGILVVACLILSLFINVQAHGSPLFTLYSYTYKSSANTEDIYPGSRNVVLVVNVKYVGDSPVYVSAGCINLPEGFTITRGYSSCVPPQTTNGTTYEVVQPGDIVVFTYHIDVGREVNPGVYEISATVHYRFNATTYGSEVVSGVLITISSYPRLSLQVVDWYWNPAGYPGSRDVYLYVTVKNTGNSRILEARGVARLSEEVFTPSNIRFQITNLGKNELTTTTLGPISIYPTADPNMSYRVVLELNATMSTDDGVDYYDQGVVELYVTLTRPPLIRLEVLDYGLETPKPVSGSRLSRFYMVLVNKDFKTIRSITACFTIKSPRALFINGTTTSITVFQGAVDYGDVVSIRSDPLIVDYVGYVDIEVKLVLFGDDNGAEFWSTMNYVFRVPVNVSSIDLEVVSVYWSSGDVYPGTERATLNVVLLNNDVVDVRDCVMTLYLPRGFYPQQFVVSDVAVQRGSMITVAFQGISIETNLTPGEYPAQISAQGVAYDPSTNTYYTFTASFVVLVRVSEQPKLKLLNVSSYGWIGDRAYTTSVNVAFYLYLQVVAPGYTIRGLRVTAILPDQLIFTSGESSRTIVSENTYRYGDHIYVELDGVNIVTDRGGVYPVVLKIEGLATSATSSYWFTEYQTILLRVFEPTLNMTLVDASWTSNPVSSESSGVGLYVVLQSYSLDTITSLVAKLTLLNAVFVDGRNYSIVTSQRAVNYGEVVSLEFTGVEVNTTDLQALLEVYAVLSTGRPSYYRAYIAFNVTVKPLEELKAFRIIAVHTTSRGEYTPLLPSSRGVVVTIEVANAKPHQVAWIKVESMAPPEIIVNDISGTCSGGVPAGGTCTINLNVDVAPTAKPGIKPLELILTYAVRTGQGLAVFTERCRVNIVVADYEYYRPKLTLISAYWGVQVPIRAIVGQRNVPLTVLILNTGYYPVDGLYVEVKPMNTSVMMVTNTSMCATRLVAGASCATTLYADLSGVVNSGVLLFEVVARYAFTLYNTLIEDRQAFAIALLVEEAASGKGLFLVDSSWSNNWPVYPGTENATLQVTLANMWPYRISGVKLELELPAGFYSKASNVASTYISGPINSQQEFTAQFTLSIGDVKPGLYVAKLRATYVVETGTPHTRVVEEYSITLLVNDPESSVQVVSVEWVGKAPEPPEYGAVLLVAVRNNLNPSMKGVVLEMELPEGFLASSTNTSYIRAPASTVNILEQARRGALGTLGIEIPPQALQELLSQLVSGATLQGAFGYGDIMYFYLKLNIVTTKRGVFTFRGYLNFIDHWNNARSIPVELNVSLLGSTKLIEIQAPLSLRIVRGAGTLTLSLVNVGSAPLYNVYVYLIPYSPMLIPQDAVRYVDVLPPHKPVNVSYVLIYNPFAIATGGVQAYLRYMSAPFTLTILYRDVYGYAYYHNTTLAVLIEPFIDIAVVNVKATLTNKTLSVVGVVANYGIATARSVLVRASYGDRSSETLLGDLDPASQSAFRVEMSVDEVVGDNLLLTIRYMDEYGRVEELNYTVKITVLQVQEVPLPRQGEARWHAGYVITLVAVIAFLAIVALMIYRYLKAHAPR